MFEIEGLDEFQRSLAEAQEALEEISGELGPVNFNPHDPSSIEGAIAEVGRLIDAKLGRHVDNRIIGPMIDDLKQQYRAGILEKAAAARLEGTEE